MPRLFVPGGAPRINWGDPLTNGLIGCYVPSAHIGPTIYNLTGLGGDLTLGSGAAYATTSEGTGLSSTASNSLASAALPSSMQFSLYASLYWRGFHIDVPTNILDLIGAEYDGTDTPPYEVYALSTNNFRTVVAAGQNGFTFNNNSQSEVFIEAPMLGSYAGTYDNTTGTINLYTFGNLDISTTSGGSPMIYGSPQIAINGYVGDTTRIINAVAMVGYVWSRVLTPQEVATIDANPYRFLVWPQDEIIALGTSMAKVQTASFGGILSIAGQTRTASMGGFLRKTVTQTASFGATLFGSVTKSAVLGGFLQKTPTKTASFDARLFKGVPFLTMDAILLAMRTDTASFDAHLTLSSQKTATFSLSIVLPPMPMPHTVSMDAVLHANFAATPSRTAIIPEIPRTIDIAY